MKYIPYGRQCVDKDDINAVISVLKGDWLTQGPNITGFEEGLAEYCGAKYAVTFNSGTSALHGAYYSLGLGEKDEFITSPNTFVATANAGVYLGARPVFVDIEQDTGNMDVQKLEKLITKVTKLIVPVHYAGHPVDMEKVNNLAQKYHLHVVEDACHAIGSHFKTGKTGACQYSDLTVFSFHPVKHITTGEGGAVLTNNKEYYNKLIMFRSHGITKENLINEAEGDWSYEMQFLGYNYRLTDIQAALGLSQLAKLDTFISKRREIVRAYEKAFHDNPYFNIPVEKDYAYSSYHLYPIRLKDPYKENKKLLFNRFRELGLGVQVHYIPVYSQPYYQNLGYTKGLCPVAEDFYQREISLPVYPSMNDQNINYVIETIFETFQEIKE